MSKAKQDPAGKSTRSAAADGRVYFSYAQIHATVAGLVPRVKEFNPDVIIAIGGGGFIPARMLRTEVKVPILAVSLELYDDNTNTKNQVAAVSRRIWSACFHLPSHATASRRSSKRCNGSTRRAASGSRCAGSGC